MAHFSTQSPNWRGRALLLVSAILVMTACVSPVVSAQETTNTTTSADNESHWVGGGNSSSGGGGGGFMSGGFGVSLDPGKWAQDAYNGLVDMFYKGIFGFVDYARNMISGFPAPGQYDKPRTWVNPQNGWWPDVKDASAWTTGLAGVMLVWGSALTFRIRNPTKRREKMRDAGKAWFLVIGTWIFAPLLAHLADRISYAIAPSTVELIQAPAKLGIGAGIAGALAILATGAFAVAVAVLGVIYFLAHACIFLWPVAWAARMYDGLIESFGDTIIYTYAIVMFINVVQAAILRLLYHIPFANGTIEGPAISFVVIVGGLVFSLVIFPKKMLDHANDAASFALGARAAQNGANKLGERTQERGRKVIEDYRNSEGGTGDSDSEPTGGAPDRTIPENSTMGVSNTNMSNSDSGTSSRTVDGVRGRSPDSTPATDGGSGIDAQDWERKQQRIEYERGRDILEDY